MPSINLQHVVSVSSEDKNCPAENLIKGDSFKKWKCATAGEKNATVTLQFEKASEINQIDIGNEGSAFVEVLVGKSSGGDDSFQVILVTSSFMNPMECRSSQNINRVRIFGQDALSKAVAGQKWDRVKVVCTQPFNQNTQFGLSFIKLYSPPSPVNEKTEGTLSKQLTLGAFVVKSDESSDAIKTGSLFEKSKQQIAEPSLTGAAAIRDASKTVEKTASVVGKAESSKGSKSAEELSPPAKIKPLEKRGSVEQADESKTKAKREPEPERSPPPAKKSKTEAATSSSTSKDKPFSQLMNKVVFVLSGFQNPLRGQLRDKAQEMGATYKGDWGRSCTHLICAFENTPKYNEIKGKGRIVKKEWVLDCHKQKKLLPWRQFRLGKAKSPKASDSDEEEVTSGNGKNKEQSEAQSKAETPSKVAESKPQEKKKNELNEEKKETKGKGRNGDRKVFHQLSNEGDTDSLSDSNSADEGKRSKGKAPMAKNLCVASTSTKKSDEDLYNASTDEEMFATEDNKSDNEFPELPDFFGGKCFFLYGDFSPEDRRLLIRYITAYNGLIIDYMDETIDFVITDKAWDEDFDKALCDNDGLNFVKSSWIHACHDAQRFVPHQKFVVAAN